MGKIDTLNEYIGKCDEVLKTFHYTDAKDLEEMIISVYSNDIRNMTQGLDSYSPRAYVTSQNGFKTTESVDYIGDIKKLRAKLLHLKDDLEAEALNKNIASKNENMVFNFNQSNSNVANANVSISFEQVLNNVTNLNITILSDDEKELLKGELLSLEQLNKSNVDKATRWKRAKSIIAWILDKGVDVGIAALPYIIQSIH